MQMFESQTQTEYCVSYQNQECANGLMKWKGEMVKYNTKWSQAYQCKRGGKGRIRPETVEVKCNTSGSTKLGCTATLRARLLPTEKGEILEVCKGLDHGQFLIILIWLYHTSFLGHFWLCSISS